MPGIPEVPGARDVEIQLTAGVDNKHPSKKKVSGGTHQLDGANEGPKVDGELPRDGEEDVRAEHPARGQGYPVVETSRFIKSGAKQEAKTHSSAKEISLSIPSSKSKHLMRRKNPEFFNSHLFLKSKMAGVRNSLCGNAEQDEG